MRKTVAKVWTVLFLSMILGGCVSFVNSSYNQTQKSAHNSSTIKDDDSFLTITAIGKAEVFSKNEQNSDDLLVKKESLANGYKQLGEQLYHINVSSGLTVEKASLRNPRISMQIDRLLQNAKITKEYFEEGVYLTSMELHISKKSWQDIFLF